MKEKIFNSPSAIAFLLIAFTVCIGFMLNKLSSSDFIILATLAFNAYFMSRKTTQTQPVQELPTVK